jgi:flagellar biosynthesis protein FliQ
VQPDVALRIAGDLFWTAFLVCLPVLGVTMLVGLTVSVLQVVTQVQEMTLTFVPKLLAAGVTLIVFGAWMLHKIMQFAIHLWLTIPSV